MSLRALKQPRPGLGLRLSVGLGVGVVATALGCREPGKPTGTADPKADAVATSTAAVSASPTMAPDEAALLLHSAHDTLGAARQALEDALRLPVDLPLPFPRVERHADRFRVVLARGPSAALRPLADALVAARKPMQLLPAGQAGADDVIRLAVVCSPADSVPLWALPMGKSTTPGRELTRVKHGQVLVLKEEDDDGAHGGHEDGDEGGGPPSLSEQGYLTVLQPQQGLVHAPDVLLPADCTPRDEDNDDGNGRILTGNSVGSPKPGQVGRLCLTTRFAGKQGRVARADLLAATPNFRRCLRFPGAGTFDGFDHSRDGSHFAVEAADARPDAPGTAKPADGKAATSVPTLRLYAVLENSASSGPLLRGGWPGLSRPAFLGDALIAVSEDAAGVAVWSVDGLGRRSGTDASALPAPRRLLQVALPGLPPLPDKLASAVHRPAAPTLSSDRVKVSFLRSCPPEMQKRVRTLVGRGYVGCLFELEVEVAMDGTRTERRCHIDNAENSLEEPLTVACP